MPTGTFDLDAATPPLFADALAIYVAHYIPGEGYEVLPNVRCLQVDQREGPDPPTARFDYVMDDTLEINFGWPSQFEEVWPVDAFGPYVVNPDDRIVVLAQNPDESFEVLFDGFAQIPQADVTSQSQRVTFAAVGVAVREYDQPVFGRIQRDSDPTGLETTDGSADIPVELPSRFNPADNTVGARAGYLPNCTPKDQDTIAGDGNLNHPVFLDPGIERDPDPRTYWTVPKAIKYLLAEHANEDFVTLPPFGTLDGLVAYYPADGFDTINPDDPASYKSRDVTIRDYDASNKPWPEVVADLISYAGFVMRWKTGANSSDLPETELIFYRRDEFAAVTPKPLYLDRAHEPLDITRNNITDFHVARDLNVVVNAWDVETAQRQVEVTVVLAPLFQPSAGDASASSRKNFFSSTWTAATTAETMRKYRWFGADECADGHWTQAGMWDTSTPFDFSAIFEPDDDGEPSYTVRYRPGSRTLISRDTDGNPLKATLDISFNYEGNTAALWDGSGTWYRIAGGWRLLEDRLGIQVTIQDPSEWNPGKNGMPYGKIDAIGWWANPPSNAIINGLQPILRLTTVIEDDLQMPIEAQKRIVSPTQFTRFRSADARDHFQYDTIDISSVNYPDQMDKDGNPGDGTNPIVVRDDTDDAQAHAYGLRSSHEFPPLAGSVTIPFITTYYDIGDRVQLVRGRDVSLQTNIGVDQGEAPCYPWVVGLSWMFENSRQQTTLHLSDRRAEPRNL
jgi:hypothetical protein